MPSADDELYQVQQHIGHFGTDRITLLRREVTALRLRHPLEVLEQFAGFDDECRSEVLRRMELLPVAFRRELSELPGEVMQ